MTRWQRERRTRFGAAFGIATLGILLAIATVPPSWIRWLLHRDLHVPAVARRVDSFDQRALRLVAPPPRKTPPTPARLHPPQTRREQAVADAEVVEEEAPENPVTPADPWKNWSYDPFNPYSVADDLFAPVLGEPDSMRRRAELLQSLTLTDLRRALALADTSAAAVARERFRRIDDWINRVYGPLWEAEGKAARLEDLYERAVTEAERKGM